MDHKEITMNVETINPLPADKKHYKMFKIGNDSSCKLEFIWKTSGYYQIRYSDNDLGTYKTKNQDMMILDFFEELATYNDGDSNKLKVRLDNLVEKKSPIINQQYQTAYKNNELKYLLGLEDNIIKAACIEQKLTYQQLADVIGVSESSLRSSASTNKISKQIEKSIEMYLEIISLKKELENSNLIKIALKSWLK